MRKGNRNQTLSPLRITPYALLLRRLRRHPRLGRLEDELPGGGGVDADVVALVDLAVEELERQRVHNPALDGALERAGAVDRIEALVRQLLSRALRQLQRQLPLRQPPLQLPDLDVHDLLDLGL